MNHVILGSSLPFIICMLLYYTTGRRHTLRYLILTPVLMILGAIWAVIPDLPRVVGMHDLYMSLSKAPWCDIFLWHYSIDMSEADEPSPLYTGILLLYIATLIRIGMMEVNRLEDSQA